MLQALNTLLQELQGLTQASREGRLSPLELETEVKKVTGKLQETIGKLTTQIQAGDSPESAYLVEVFQTQIRTILEQSGMKPEPIIEEEGTEELSQDLERLKRGPVRT